MPKKKDGQPEGHVSLSMALLDLRVQSERVRDDMNRVIGVLNHIHESKNVYDLQHRLKSLLGRERSTTRMLRRWIACLEPLEIIAASMGE